MAKCGTCGKAVSFLTFDVLDDGTRECVDCWTKRANTEAVRQSAEAEPHNAKAGEIQMNRFVGELAESQPEHVSGAAIIGVSIVIGALGALMTSSPDFRLFGFGVIGVAAMVCIAGVIRRELAGSKLLNLDRMQRQNAEVIELLETIAAQGKFGAELNLLQRLRSTGQISKDEYRAQRNQLLRPAGDKVE